MLAETHWPGAAPGAIDNATMSAVRDFLLFFAFATVQLVVSILQLVLSPLAFALDRLRATAPPKKFKSVLITGGSSGLGAALAEVYAAPGVQIAITGRNAERLADVKKRCEAKGASVRLRSGDTPDDGRRLTCVPRVTGGPGAGGLGVPLARWCWACWM